MISTSVLFSDPVKPVNQNIWPGGNLKLHCHSPSNLATTGWERDKRVMASSLRHQFLQDGLLILNASDSDAGLYRCLSVERSGDDEYTTTVAEYKVSVGSTGRISSPQAQRDGPSMAGLQAVVVLLVVSLLALLGWNFYKGHIPLPWNCRRKGEQSMESHEQRGLNSNVTHQDATRSALVEEKPLVSGANNGNRNNNDTDGEVGSSARERENEVTLPSLQYIDDESEN